MMMRQDKKEQKKETYYVTWVSSQNFNKWIDYIIGKYMIIVLNASIVTKVLLN